MSSLRALGPPRPPGAGFLQAHVNQTSAGQWGIRERGRPVVGGGGVLPSSRLLQPQVSQHRDSGVQ